MPSKYIISGIGPGKGGVGALVQSLELRKNRFNYNSLYIHNPSVSIVSLLKKRKLINFAYELTLWFWSFFIINIRVLLMRNKKIILLYPQYFHSYVLAALIKNNEVALYVVDNSFFCIKSYNYLKGQECTKCVDSLNNIDKSCTPFPILWSKKSAVIKLKKLKLLSQYIFFLSQNKHQLILLEKVFGEEIKGDIVGMDTGEFCDQPINKNKYKYDIVYHGGNIDAKGILYVLEIAKHLDQYSFLIPSVVGEKNCNLPNVYFIDCTWSTGLKDYVVNAKLVMCPSIWSSPIESALLKSIAYNGNVAVYDNEFGFQNDVDSKVLLRLSNNVKISCKLIDDFIRSDCDNSFYSKKWLKTYCSSLNDKKIFEWNINNSLNKKR
jgi:hypothetical protein